MLKKKIKHTLKIGLSFFFFPRSTVCCSVPPCPLPSPFSESREKKKEKKKRKKERLLVNTFVLFSSQHTVNTPQSTIQTCTAVRQRKKESYSESRLSWPFGSFTFQISWPVILTSNVGSVLLHCEFELKIKDKIGRISPWFEAKTDKRWNGRISTSIWRFVLRWMIQTLMRKLVVQKGLEARMWEKQEGIWDGL